MSDSIDGGGGSRLENADFWEELQETFETAIGLLHEIAEAQGINVEMPAGGEIREEEERLDRIARSHPLVLQAEAYAEEVDIWFRGAKEAVRTWGIEATEMAEADVLTFDIEREADDLQEAIETIADARYRINVKLLRALRSRLRMDSAVLSTVSGASEKAAVEAYVLVEDSIRHWMRLREIIPEEEDAILRILVRLGKLRGGVEAEFAEVADVNEVQHVDRLEYSGTGVHPGKFGESGGHDGVD